MLARLFVYLQYLLPRYALTAIVHRVARIRLPGVKNRLIRNFVQTFKVELTDVDADVPDDFASLNAFFTRELADGARPVDDDPRAIASPADGTLSAAGLIHSGRVFQAKGLDYTVEDLLTVDTARSAAFLHGRFATIYLAPYDYHRVHAPFSGRLDALHYVPGDLFSVNTATVRRVRGLFRRNERLVMHFDTAFGPAAVVFVGALNVGSITTPWTGEIRPRRRGSAEVLPLGSPPPAVEKGELLGWFNMGSTVIVLLPADAGGDWVPGLDSGSRVRVGQRIGILGYAR